MRGRSRGDRGGAEPTPTPTPTPNQVAGTCEWEVGWEVGTSVDVQDKHGAWHEASVVGERGAGATAREF